MNVEPLPSHEIDSLLPWYPVGFVVAAALGLYFTPVFRDAARRFGIVDAPDGRLKTHQEPVAYLGGLAVYLAFLLTQCAIPNPFEQHTLGLMLGGSVILLLGFVDDLKSLSPAVKFLGQLLAALVLLKAGIEIRIGFLPPEVAKLATVLWIVTITNAFNIIDVADGLCSGVGAISFAGLFSIAVLNGVHGQSESASIALFIACFTGSLIGFLRFNFRPAQIYLGDAGSMLIGFFAGSIAMILSYAEIHPIATIAPLFLLGVPLFDLGLVIVLRLRKGLSPFRGSPDHFAVRLRRHGVSAAKIALTSYFAAALLAGLGIALTQISQEQAKLLIGIAFVALIASGIAISRIGNAPRA